MIEQNLLFLRYVTYIFKNVSLHYARYNNSVFNLIFVWTNKNEGTYYYSMRLKNKIQLAITLHILLEVPNRKINYEFGNYLENNM